MDFYRSKIHSNRCQRVVNVTRKMHKFADCIATDRRDGLYRTLTVSFPLTDNT